MPLTYILIASNVLGSNAASVTFSSISNAYTDLVFMASFRTSRSLSTDQTRIRFNNDASSLYSFMAIAGDGATAFRNASSNRGDIFTGDGNAATSLASTFSSLELYIPSYTRSQNKPTGSFLVQENNTTTAYTTGGSQVYNSTSEISTITIIPSVGPDFLTGSSFYLYGIKNS
jgi:hypothetical protein